LKLSLIVAMSRNGIIGNDGKLPWPKIPEDMANFKRLTMGHAVIVGRKTFESLDKPLKGRRNIILSRSMNLTEDLYYGKYRICIVRTPTEAIVEAFESSGDEAFVIGGAEIYRLLGPLCDEAHVTLINRDIDGDTMFPDCDMCNGWEVAEKRQLAAGVFYSHRIKTCPKPTTPDTSA
jgi:dihydrofolate reductase